MVVTRSATYPHRDIGELFADTLQLVGPALESAASTSSEGMRTIMRYHLGWCDRGGEPTTAGSGKMLRATAVLLSARAAGGSGHRDALAAAVAVELVHNFSLMHDDVIDGDHTRRHRPAVWTVFGTPAAILVGDALLGMAYATLSNATGPLGTSEALRWLGKSVERMIVGQAMDLRLASLSAMNVPLAEAMTMAQAKTGALLGGACALGALSAGASPDLVRQMYSFGEDLGLAFQLVDDVLGIWGDPGKTGKPARSDLQSRKKSLPVVFALGSGGDAAEELRSIYELPRELTDVELNRAAMLVDQSGGRRWARSEAEERVDAALLGLASWDLDPGALAELSLLAARVCDRSS